MNYQWSDPYRGDRVMEVLTSGRQHTMQDMAELQTDYLSIPAREIIPMITHLKWEDTFIQSNADRLQDWNFNLDPKSIEATIYVELEDELKRAMNDLVVPDKIKGELTIQLKKVIDFLLYPDAKFGADPIAGRDEFLKSAFQRAMKNLKMKFGDDVNLWNYGSAIHKHITLKHPMSNAITDDMRSKLEVGPAPRGGNAYTVNMTSSNLNQTSGGSFKIICDTGNWDHTLATNTPGQNGNPDHAHYRNLFDLWARDQYFPLFYSKEKIEGVISEVWKLE